jgi:hypothetical protein
MYDSHQLYGSPYSLINYGETRQIVGAHKSLETKTPGRLTYVQDNKQLKEAYIDANGQVKKDTIMLLDPKNYTIEDAFVFDEVAAVKVKDYFFTFFRRPLTLNSFTSYLTDTAGSEKGNREITAWDFRLAGDGL